MDGPFNMATVTGLAEALRLDPTLAAEPERLRRALDDLAPGDERGGWLLTCGAMAGVPALIKQGLSAEAHARLSELTACRADAVAWTVAAWARVLTGDDGDGPAGLPDEADGLDDVEQAAVSGVMSPAEEPGTPTALRVALWPDGAPMLAVVTMQGIFVVDGVDAYRRWRRVATVRAPLSRDVALCLEPVPGLVVWTDHDGVHARSARRHGGELLLGDPRMIAVPPADGQARYPVAALGDPAGDLSVLWTADRFDLTLTEQRSWVTSPASVRLPRACGAGERLDGLHGCLETERTGWLLCLTDRGRLLAASWDVSLNEAGGWIDLEPPAVPVTAALACVGQVPFAIAATRYGDLLSLNVRRAAAGDAEWHSVDRPVQVSAAPPPRVIAAGARYANPTGPGWLALAGSAGTWAMPVTRSGDVLECGSPANVWTGE